jgi:uncharacterized membrane protein
VREWLRRICLAVGMGLIWAVVWTAVGGLIRIVDRSGAMDELWLGPAIGLFPGFVGGVIFSAVFGIAASWRGLDALSLPTVVACGAMAGLVVGVLPFAINEPTSEAPLWLVAVVVIGSMTLLSAVSAAGSLALVRRARAKMR